MRRIVGILLLALALTVPVATVSMAADATAHDEREEVEQRLELNKVSAEELAATGAVDLETAKRIIQLRDDLGGFQTYDDLQELNIPEDQMEKLRWNTTIEGIASDCTC